MPLSKDFSAEYLYKASKNRNVAIKSRLMNSKMVVGIGNIYASESLFLSKIRPDRISKKLTKKNGEDLVTSIKKVLKSAIQNGGYYINDNINMEGKSGDVQNDFKIYDRTAKTLRIVQRHM